MKAPDCCSLFPVLLVAAPLLGMMVNIGAQLVLSRLPLAVGNVRRQFVSFGCGLLVATGGLLALLFQAGVGGADFAGYLALHTGSYACLGFCFFNVINMNISSLRIRMLKEYLRQHPLPLPDEALVGKYPVRDMLDARLDRLERGRQISHSGGRFFWRRGTVTVIAHFFAGLRRFLLGG
jgi:hypothetical protein